MERFSSGFESGVGAKQRNQFIGQKQCLRGAITRELLHHINLLWVNGDGQISRERPRCRCPNSDARFTSEIPARDRKLDVNSGIVALLILDLSLGQRSLGAGAPENRLFRLVNQTLLDKNSKSAQNFRFVLGIHGQVWIFPIAQDTESFELFALNVDVLASKRF